MPHQSTPKIESRSLSDLKPYANNARVHSGDQIAELARSIRELGLRNPLLIRRDGEIVCGHGRFKAAQQLGLETVNCIVADDMTEEQVKLYRIADNRLAEKSTWDTDLLKLEFGDILKLDSVDLSLSGFEPPQILQMIREPEQRVATSPKGEWTGMPEFQHDDDEQACLTIKVHFRTEDDVRSFCELIGQELKQGGDGKYTKMIWFPKAEIRKMMDKRYGAEEPA